MKCLAPFILSIFGSTLTVLSAGNSANFLYYLAICLAAAIVFRKSIHKVAYLLSGGIDLTIEAQCLVFYCINRGLMFTIRACK